jgi:transposase
MAQKSRKRFPEEFKQQIVDLYNAGTSVTKLASEYGLIEQTIYKWIKLYDPIIEGSNGDAVSMKEYKELQKKMAQIEMENEILKKATAIFARKQ